jgi:hypothetical protein
MNESLINSRTTQKVCAETYADNSNQRDYSSCTMQTAVDFCKAHTARSSGASSHAATAPDIQQTHFLALFV